MVTGSVYISVPCYQRQIQAGIGEEIVTSGEKKNIG